MDLSNTLHSIALPMTHDREDREIAGGGAFLLLDGRRTQPRSMTATAAGLALALRLDDPNHGLERALMLPGSERVGPSLP